MATLLPQASQVPAPTPIPTAAPAPTYIPAAPVPAVTPQVETPSSRVESQSPASVPVPTLQRPLLPANSTSSSPSSPILSSSSTFTPLPTSSTSSSLASSPIHTASTTVSTPSNSSVTIIVTTTATDSPSSSSSPASLQSNTPLTVGSSGLHGPAKHAVAVIVPVFFIGVFAAFALLFYRRHKRRGAVAYKDEKEHFEPNSHDGPSSPLQSLGYAVGDDAEQGYRGWNPSGSRGSRNPTGQMHSGNGSTPLIDSGGENHQTPSPTESNLQTPTVPSYQVDPGSPGTIHPLPDTGLGISTSGAELNREDSVLSHYSRSSSSYNDHQGLSSPVDGEYVPPRQSFVYRQLLAQNPRPARHGTGYGPSTNF